jgi:hypothetical protein
MRGLEKERVLKEAGTLWEQGGLENLCYRGKLDEHPERKEPSPCAEW